MEQSALPFDGVDQPDLRSLSAGPTARANLSEMVAVPFEPPCEAPATYSSDRLEPTPASDDGDRQARVEFVRHPRARRYLIRVRLDGSVRVTIPRRGSKRGAAAFYADQQGWISSQQQRVERLRQTIPQDLPPDVQKRLRREARTFLPARLRELAQQVGVTVGRVSIRNQRQRWGSCSTSGAISLNWRLMSMPGWVRDYVIYHELMHTKRMDHSPAFWALVKEVCPNYEEARRWLRRHAHAPHAGGC